MPRPLTLILSLALLATLLASVGCYRKEVRRRAWPGFAVESNATPAPRAQTPDIPRNPGQPEPDVLGAVFSPFGKAIDGVGRLFQGDQSQNYTPPQPDGQPHKPKSNTGRRDAGDPVFTPAPTDSAPTTQTRP